MLNRRNFLASTAGMALAGSAKAAMALAGPAPIARSGEANAALDRAFDRFYQAELDASPELVTSLGLDNGGRVAAKALLDDRSLAGTARRKALVHRERGDLRFIDRAGLTPAAAIDYDTALYRLTMADTDARRFAYPIGAPYVVSQLGGAYAEIPDFLTSQHTIATTADAEAYLARLDAFAAVLDQETDRVRHDAALGVVPPDFAIDGALMQILSLRRPAASASLVTTLATAATSAKLPGDWQGRAAKIYTQRVVPAIDRQLDQLAGLRPKAVHDAGVWRLPDGEAYYAACLRAMTTTDLSPGEVHRIGLDVTRELTARADTLFRQIGMSSGSVAERYQALYKNPKFLYPNTDAGKQKQIGDLSALVDMVQARLPDYFATLPRAKLEIRRIPAATEAAMSTHYNSGSLDGSRPGIFWINLRDTAESPFWAMPTLTFHEGTPGHHLQMTLQSQSDLPAYRKIQGFGAYIEGWAMYAEQLADEMGLYKGQPAWELGYIHDALLRAARLVVDTGIHAQRWSREQAIRTMRDITGAPVELMSQEVERYACIPGQACSYMIGKRTFVRLRDKARAALGGRFDIRKFHDAVLLGGPVPLTVLETQVDLFIASTRPA